MKALKLYTIILTSLMFAIGCGKASNSFSTLPTGQNFVQSTSFNNQLDILWVIDNSGSMQPYQDNLTANFNAFISGFVNKGYDFKIAVTGTDAFRGDSSLSGYSNNWANYARFRDGYFSNSGIFVILPTTPNIQNVFLTNARLGTNGSGDERAFSSFRTSLNSNLNSGFLRPNSFLAIIILSDEDDFSGNGRCLNCGTYHNYNASTLDSVQSYVDYLDQKTNSSGATKRYTVSSISVIDQQCYNQNAAYGSIIGTRYMQLTQATGGVSGSICDSSYAGVLDQMQSQIAELSTQFYLNRVPIVSTIVVIVNGVTIANDVNNGWTYNAEANSIVFHGSSIPAQGASINIDFIPQTLVPN
ncbi:MAG: hypothetical protein IPM57_06185 [Oligoflexia bacterium]|nr:hypothetical protein [Oligoflexia bacterium]